MTAREAVPIGSGPGQGGAAQGRHALGKTPVPTWFMAFDALGLPKGCPSIIKCENSRENRRQQSKTLAETCIGNLKRSQCSRAHGGLARHAQHDVVLSTSPTLLLTHRAASLMRSSQKEPSAISVSLRQSVGAGAVLPLVQPPSLGAHPSPWTPPPRRQLSRLTQPRDTGPCPQRPP